MTQTWCTPVAMLPAADAVPPPDAASPPVVHVKVKWVASGTLATAKVPLYVATPMLVLVMSWPSTQFTYIAGATALAPSGGGTSASGNRDNRECAVVAADGDA